MSDLEPGMSEQQGGAPLFDAADGRTLAEVALRSITASTARARGDDFLRILVRDLARALDVTHVIAGRAIILADGGEGIRTLAVWGSGGYLPNLEYSLQHTPCQNVTDQVMCFHASVKAYAPAPPAVA